MDVIGVIPARYGSSRLEGKVLADIAGKPMLEHVWQRAKKASLLDRLVIACDDQRVFEVARGFGADCVMTSREHSCGTDRLAEVVSPLEAKVIINIQADEPLVDPMMINRLAETLLSDDSIQMATLKKEITDIQEINNPGVVKVITDKNDFALYFSRAAVPFRAANSEVEAVYYKHIGLYAYTKDFLFVYKNIAPSQLEKIERLEQLRVLEEGLRIKVIETKCETIGVDTPEDLEKARRAILGADYQAPYMAQAQVQPPAEERQTYSEEENN